ncbi:MAG: hypothetical protein WCK58_12470 [Chloroflexota bacterium]
MDDYQGRIGQRPMITDLGPLYRMLAHALATDPERFWVAEGGAEGEAGTTGGEGVKPFEAPVCGFASATVREGLWFLAMLFVRPDLQAAGVGSALLDRAQAGRDVDHGGPAVPGPDQPFDTGIHTWGMCTDAAQPISNALYARRGMPSRMPIWRLAGEVHRWPALPALPASLAETSFEQLAFDGRDGGRRLAEIVNALDREILGAAHPEEHGYLRRDGRSGYLVRDRASGKAVGYTYGSGGGRLGPVATLDPALAPAMLGVAIRETPILGTMAAWVPGTFDEALRGLLDAGLRLEGFPGLVCWSRPELPFDRYVPISLALV